ncbi:hypothetical protein ACIRS1_02215 [Kitasatospora sp. NPDC101176]|uniref:hypothetical protein n=1 Tax=Kitasatospora sp. NPDC101176 TaxID=3364099 RepID=UPI0038207FBE
MRGRTGGGCKDWQNQEHRVGDGMELEELAERISAAGSSGGVIPGFLPIAVEIDQEGPLATVHLGGLLDIDLRPAGDWSDYWFFCGGFVLEEMPGEAAIAAVLAIARGEARVRTTGRWIFRDRVLELDLAGETWRAFRPPSDRTPRWEQLLGG